MRNVFITICTIVVLCLNLTSSSILVLAQGLSSPVVETGEATDVTSSSATLNGTSSSQRVPNAWFEYGTVSGSYDNSVSAEVTFGASKNVWKASITGLSPATIYYYRIAANDSYPGYTTDTAYGDEKSLTTLEATATPTPSITPTVIPTPECEELCTEDATDITSSSAMLNGRIYKYAVIGREWFEYGTTIGSLSRTVEVQRWNEQEPYYKVSANVSELSPETTYYYRLVGQDKMNTYYGSEKSLMTLSATTTPYETPVISPTPVCDVESIEISPNRLTLRRGKSSEVTVILKGKEGCSTEGEIVTAIINKVSSNRISVAPANQAMDENGQAKFTITAKNKAGNAKVTFMIEDFPNINKTMLVKVR
ncbi:MAG TPA: fibronectin type III domain-containing protein [Candidatus Wunengus sp. YC63]|uniref:fibronectin type III domain-containing protein n=1 Tax=unclassified Candidatus Wunengus TaxID=3367695 RepID=UPI0040261EE8